MPKWTTIITFNHSYDAQLAKSRLEADGIEVFLKDELTVQVQTHLASAIGGIKLQVREEQLIKAVHILKSLNYNMDAQTPGPFWLTIAKHTTGIPILNKLPVELRLLVLVAIFLTILGIPLYFLIVQSGI